MKLWPLIFRLTCIPCWQYELWGPNQYLRARWASVHAQTADGIETNVGGIPGHYWFFNPYECSRIESGHSNTHVLGKTWRILHPKSGISIAQANSAEANSSSLQQQAQKLRVNGFGELFCWLFFQRCIFCFFSEWSSFYFRCHQLLSSSSTESAEPKIICSQRCRWSRFTARALRALNLCDGWIFLLLLLVAMDNHSIILYRFGIARHDHLWADRLCVFSLQPAVPESLSLGLIRGLHQVNGRVYIFES